MDIQQLRYFTVLATTGNFTRASTELHLTQPALSKSISAMEAELGLELLARTKKGATLTECGKEFCRFAQSVLTEYDHTCQRMMEIRENRKNAVNLTVTLPEIFVQILEGFHHRHPDIQVRLPASSTISAQEMLALGSLDFVVNTAPMKDERIEWQPLMQDEYLLMVPEDMPFTTGQAIDLSMFREEPFIMPQSESESRRQMEFFCSLAGFTPNIAFEVTENEMTRKLVQFGYGVAFIPGVSAVNTIEIPPESEGLGKVSVKFLRIRNPICYRTIGINRIKNQKLSTSADLLLNYFIDFFQTAQQRSDRVFPPL